MLRRDSSAPHEELLTFVWTEVMGHSEGAQDLPTYIGVTAL